MNSASLKKLVAQNEGVKLDFKRDVREETLRDLSKDIAAFANTEGGHIIVGVSDDHDLIGVDMNSDIIGRIYGEASSCRPRVQVNVSEEKLRGKRLIVIEVPKSNWLHTDKHMRFPQRLGQQTGFMEASLLLSLAKERGLIDDESSLEYEISEPIKRKKPLQEHEKLIEYLSKLDPTLRMESLKDLESLSSWFKIEDLPRIFDKLVAILEEGVDDIRLEALTLVDSLRRRTGTKRRRQLTSKLVPHLVKFASGDYDHRIRDKAVQILSETGDPICIEIIMKIVVNEPEEVYKHINPQNHLIRIVEAGLGSELRQRMYSELSKSRPSEISDRIINLLNTLRRVRPV